MKNDSLFDPLFCDKGSLTPLPIPFEFLFTLGAAGNLSAIIFCCSSTFDNMYKTR